MHTHTQTGPRVYKTADLYFAAYLSVAGMPVENLVKEGRRCYFHFHDEGQLEDLRKQYYNRTARIPALQFTEEIKNLKNQTAEAMQTG